MAGIETMTDCNDKLVIALSGDPLGTATVLLAKRFIDENIEARMLLPSLTGRDKAVELVSAVRNTIKNTPERFHEFVDILNQTPSNKDIVKILLTTYASKSSKNYKTDHVIFMLVSC